MKRAIVILVVSLLAFACSENSSKLASPVRPNTIEWWMLAASSEQGQADAHLIRFASGENLLIDAGEAGNRLVPRLHSIGIDRIDKILVSHGHSDHYNGIRSLLRSSIRIGAVYFNMPPRSVCRREADWGCKVDEITQLLTEVRKRGIAVREQRAGDRIVDHGGIRLDVLYAFDGEQTPVGATTANDMSAILLLANRDTRALFTGDLNHAIGSYLANLKDPELRATLLKVPHHGAESVAPNAFFDWVDAKAALVPAPAELWRSDRDARVRNYFAGKSIPTFVSGIDGDVRIVLHSDRYEIFKVVL